MTKNAVAMWPEVNAVDIVCPWCGSSTKIDLRSVKEFGEASRLDQCRSCMRDIIVEPTASGVVVSRGIDVSKEYK